MALYRTSGANPTGDAVEVNVLSGKIFSNDSGTDKVGTMPNNGAVSPSALSPNGSYTIPEGYHNGNGVVSASPNTGTYSPTTRNAALDMGISNLNRYVNTTGVPNSNSGTYTFASGDTGGTKDLGVTNTYRYVNATNVYNKGKADGASTNNKFILRASALGTTAYGGIILNYNYLKQFTKVKPVMLYGSGAVTFFKCDDYPADNSYTQLATFNNNQDNYLPTLSTNTFYLLQFASSKGICELTFS